MNYDFLSKVYDLSMQDVDYESWYKLIKHFMDFSKIDIKNILELGCGTGNITVQLLNDNYEVLAIDKSVEMLSIASEKTKSFGQKIIYVNQDIRDINLNIYEIDMILAVNDVINYIYNYDDLLNLFIFANKHLKKGGIFLFDYSSENKFNNILSSNVFTEDFGEFYYIWKNFYDKSKKEITMDIDIFELNPNKTYNRYHERHVQKTYRENEIKNLLVKSGFNKIISFCDFDKKNFDFDSSQRIFFYVQKDD